MVSLLILLLASAGSPSTSPRGSSTSMTGTYSSLTLHAATGDLLGAEIRIAYTRDGYQATVQVSEGEPSSVVVVNVRLVGGDVLMDLPEETLGYKRFEGKIQDKILVGDFISSQGGRNSQRMKRGCGYWDR